MNGISIFCDTNPLIYLLNGDRSIARFLDNKQIYISVITELELFGKPNLSIHDNKMIDSLIESCFVIDINQEIKDLYRTLKRNYNIKLPDAVIASTALYLDMPLFTHDQVFQRLPNLKLITWI